MRRYWKYLAVGLLALAVFVPAASAHPGVFVRGYYGPGWGWGWYGPAYYGPAYYGWYDTGYYGAYGGAVPSVGKVKIETKMRDASVYVDGGYAGKIGDLKTFPLKPGTHDIELRSSSGESIFQQHVEVLAGKTIKLTP